MEKKINLFKILSENKKIIIHKIKTDYYLIQYKHKDEIKALKELYNNSISKVKGAEQIIKAIETNENLIIAKYNNKIYIINNIDRDEAEAHEKAINEIYELNDYHESLKYSKLCKSEYKEFCGCENCKSCCREAYEFAKSNYETHRDLNIL